MPHSDTTAQAARRPIGQVILGVIVAVLGVVTVLQGIASNTATQHLARCQGSYVNHFADALDARTAASAEAQNALDYLMRTVRGNLAQTPASDKANAVRAALDNYLAKRADAETERKRHPYPSPPRNACG